MKLFLNRFLLQKIPAAEVSALCPGPALAQLPASTLHHPQPAPVQPAARPAIPGAFQKTVDQWHIMRLSKVIAYF